MIKKLTSSLYSEISNGICVSVSLSVRLLKSEYQTVGIKIPDSCGAVNYHNFNIYLSIRLSLEFRLEDNKYGL